MRNQSQRPTTARATLLLAIQEVRAILAAPFRYDADSNATLEEEETNRRSALARLIMLMLAVGEVVVATVLVALRSPLLVDLSAISLPLCSLGALRLTYLWRPMLVTALYLAGSMLLLTLQTAVSSTTITASTVLILALLVVAIFITGLVFPPWAIPLTAIFGIGLIALSLAVHQVSLANVRIEGQPTSWMGTFGLFIMLFLLVGVLSWISHASARAGVRTAARAAQRERELADLKDQFIIDTNHELRTPIMALYGNVEMLASLDEDVAPEIRARLLTRALESGDRVLKLLRSILDASSLEAGVPDITLAPVPLRAAIMEALQTFDPNEFDDPGLENLGDASRDVTVEIPPSVCIYADAGRLRQILLNLLTNALKYSAAESPIVIGAHEAGTMTQITLRDFGLGVPPAEASKLFQRFVRLERDIAGPTRGTGVGLFICRTLVEAMGGQIGVESRGIAGEGSTFWFTLPTAPKVAIEHHQEDRITAKLSAIQR